MKKNKYKPETEFEKEIFSDLIDKIRSVKDEELSQDFDKNFSSALEKVTPVKPLGMKVRELTAKRKFKLYISFASAAVAVLILFITFSEKNIPSKYNLPGRDSSNIFISHDSSKHNKDNNTLKRTDNYSRPQNNITGNNKRSMQNSDKALNPKLFKPDSLNSILKSKDSISSGEQFHKSH